MNDNSTANIVSLDVDDGALVLAARRGDEQAFAILVARYQRKIFVAALRYTRVREDAEDVVQQAFHKAFTHLHRFEGKSSFCTWLTRIAINEALMLLRKGRSLREVSLEDTGEEQTTARGIEIPDSGQDPEMNCLQRERTEALLAALKTLTPRLRATIELKELAELSTRETARSMGVSIAAVKARVFHGMAKLRKTVRFGTTSKGLRRLTASSGANGTCSGFRLQSR